MDIATINYSYVPCFSVSKCWTANHSPSYNRHLFDFEKNFNGCPLVDWHMANWTIIFYVIAAYLVAIFTGQHLMKSRPQFQLRKALVSWNVAMAVFSIFCAWRTVTAVLYQIDLEGFHHTACSYDYPKQYHQALGLYGVLFGYSKIVELGDTAFIVLRKTPLIILHWFHHASVGLFVWSSMAYPSPFYTHCMAMNYFVHSFMYSYYVMKALKIRVPKPIGMAITSLQLFQMLGGLFLAFYTYYMRATPIGCCVFDVANQITLSIYFAYFVLFSNFFIRSYLSKKPSPFGPVKKSN